MNQTANHDTESIIAKIATEYTQLENCVTYAHISAGSAVRVNDGNNQSVKIEHSLFLLLAKGSLDVNYNFERYEVKAPACISFPPGTMLHIDTKDLAAVDAYVLDYSPKFLQEVNISFNAISGQALIDRKTPVFDLKDNEMTLLLRYFSLIQSVLSEHFNTQLSKHIVSNLTSALFYQFVLLLYKRIDLADSPEGLGPRRGNYVHDFMKLVHLYYTKERSVGFYASKLFISPKYLSLLVKEATGRSAARWIDQFVIMEAKNLLRYSGKNIQQVAYDLNFSNQSSFGKYFKHLTGMSPTEFQKS
ncbi:MAG: helix-turn-helix domain-containing protein [Muribaculaceae bacterium]|nr:helix-turn-helix domain-containing protein [Muribaculaceae bacterium]